MPPEPGPEPRRPATRLGDPDLLIEIRKAGFINKGAELMLHAALEQLGRAYPDASFVMAPTSNREFAPYAKRSELGLLQKVAIRYRGIEFGDLAAIVPRRFRERYGVVLDSEVDAVIDAAGFSYSDHWGMGSTKILAQAASRWRKRGTKLVLLPQALGPFESRRIRTYLERAVENIDLLFAREPVSYQHVTKVVGERPNIKMAPDFTNLIDGILPEDFDADANRFAVVPNYRMIDKTSADVSERYLPFMTACTKYLQEQGQRPFLLVHEGPKDLWLAERIAEGVAGPVPIVKEDHPLKIKGILGACEGTLGSRFHGLVSALCQGVPSLATGWSHKYQMLFEDYGFPEGLLDLRADEGEIHEKIDMITDLAKSREISSLIAGKADELKARSRKMWEAVFQVLGAP